MSVNPFLRILYWVTWFFLVPAILAGFAFWLLFPSHEAACVGPLRLFQALVQSQPVLVAFVLLMSFELLAWSQRHVLPLASLAGMGGRKDVPVSVRKRIEQAQGLLDEAARLQQRHHKDLLRNTSEKERATLSAHLHSLRKTMEAEKFDRPDFEKALSNAQESVNTTLARWRKSGFRQSGEQILLAIFVVLFLRAFVVEVFNIPSRSMLPTLAVGDHIFVNKFAYGPMIPFTHTRLYNRLPPSPGDVIVFQFPEQPDQDFIKRVIGRPGDKIEVIAGRPRINGWLVPRCRVGEFSYLEGQGEFAKHHGELFVEYLGKEAYLTFFDHTMMSHGEKVICKQDADCVLGQGCADGFCGQIAGPFVVQPDQVFMMGDNRMNSHDSRGWFDGRGGGVPFALIRGRALWVWMSLSPEGGMARERIGVSVMGTPRLPSGFHESLRGRIEECMNDHPGPAGATPPSP